MNFKAFKTKKEDTIVTNADVIKGNCLSVILYLLYIYEIRICFKKLF